MSIYLFDPVYRTNLLPLTFTRSMGDLLTGMMTIKEWWQLLAKEEVYILTVDYLQKKYPLPVANGRNIFINASVIPEEKLWSLISSLQEKECVKNESNVLLAFADSSETIDISMFEQKYFSKTIYSDNRAIEQSYQLFQWNHSFFKTQFSLLTAGKKSADISETNLLIGKENIFIEDGCTIEGCIINANDGPVYISKNCIVMEGSCIRGPFFAGGNSVIKMGTKIYGATSIGKKCTVGGELKNVIIHHYSNKAHDGYLGDSVVGSWCNLGAGTSCSNVKNTAGNVELYSYSKNKYIDAGLKCGTIMGDYSRTAINTSINTGCNIGVSCNLIDINLSAKLYENFSWGNEGKNAYQLEKAFEHISNWMSFKNETLNNADKEILAYLYTQI